MKVGLFREIFLFAIKHKKLISNKILKKNFFSKIKIVLVCSETK